MRQVVVLLALVLPATLALAQAVDVPKRKSGLWEVKRADDSDRPPLQWCIDEKTDNALNQLAQGRHKEHCKIDKLSHEGDRWVVDAVCTTGRASTAKTHAVVTGKFDSSYKIESTSTFDKAVHGKSETKAVIEGRWTGPCKPDQKPGDVILADGRKVNVIDEAKATSKSKATGRRGGYAAGKKQATPPATTPPATTLPATTPPATTK